MKGDYYRYLAEVATGETRNSKYLFCNTVLGVPFMFVTLTRGMHARICILKSDVAF
jgi:hypothetical protein